MKKSIIAISAVLAALALSACGSVRDQNSLNCQSAKLAAGEPYNNNDMGPSYCPRAK